MVTEPARTESLEAARAILSDPSSAGAGVVVVPVSEAVPSWLAELVVEAHAAGCRVAVSAEPAAIRDRDAQEGWEIGVATAALSAGVDELVGIADARRRRVQVVVAALDHGAAPSAEAAP